MDYITIASTGNTSDFGDLLATTRYSAGLAGTTRGVFGGGVLGTGHDSNVLQYISIASTGNAIDFGDLLGTTPKMAACSNAHGGIA